MSPPSDRHLEADWSLDNFQQIRQTAALRVQGRVEIERPLHKVMIGEETSAVLFAGGRFRCSSR